MTSYEAMQATGVKILEAPWHGNHALHNFSPGQTLSCLTSDKRGSGECLNVVLKPLLPTNSTGEVCCHLGTLLSVPT